MASLEPIAAFDRPDLDMLSTALEGSPVTVFFQDADDRFVWIENQQSIWASDNLVGLTDAEVFTPESTERLANVKKQALADEAKQTVELTPLEKVVADGSECRLKVTVQAMRGADGALRGYLCASLDITLEMQRERTLKSLLREVAHRSKNMLAMVLSLSAQTARSARTTDGFLRSFTGRVQSLAKSQDVITERNWTGAGFRDLVDQQVFKVVQLGGARIEVTGSNPNFTPSAALHVGLALHELVTNALVHGALIQPQGRIVIDCTIVEEAGHSPTARLTWKETTPEELAVPPASERSFGRTMLERVVPAAVNGTGTLSFSTDGVLYTLTIASTEFY